MLIILAGCAVIVFLGWRLDRWLAKREAKAEGSIRTNQGRNLPPRSPSRSKRTW